MDAFEAEHARGQGTVYFRDKVPVPRLFLAFIAVGACAMTLALMNSPFPQAFAIAFGVIGGLAAFFVNLALLGLRIVVSDGGIDVFTGVRRRNIPASQITSAEVAEFARAEYPFGRGVVRKDLRLRDTAYVSDFAVRSGVRVTLRDGSSVLITSNDPAGLLAAIERMRGGGVRVDASEAEAESEPVEVETQRHGPRSINEG